MIAVVHLVNGTRIRLSLADAEARARLLGGLKPAKVFSDASLGIATGSSVAAIATGSVECIAFEDLQAPETGRPANVASVDVVSEEEFARAIGNEETLARRRAEIRPGDTTPLLVRLHLASGRCIAIRAVVTLRPGLDQMLMFRNLLKAGAVWANGEGGHGSVLINMAAVPLVTLHPGPPTVPPETWSVDSMEILK